MKVPRSVRTVAISVFVVVVLAFFAYSLTSAWHETHGELPSLARLVTAALLVGIGLLAASVAWAALLGDGNRVDNAATLLVSQLGKYIPGAVWQAASQIGLAKSAGARVGRSMVAFTVMALTQAIAGCVYAVVLAVVWTDASAAVRIALAVGGLASLALLDRRWMVKVLHKIPRTRSASAAVVPPQRAILISFLATFTSITTTSVAYVLLLASFGPLHDPVLVLSGYAVAWTIGYIAVPIPSGLGIREAFLAAILHGTLPSSVIVAASVYLRLASITVEGILAAGVAHRVRPARLAAARAALNDEGQAPAATQNPEVE